MIRLYGHSLGHASFAQVTRGFRIAAESAGLLAGFVPIDDLAVLEDEPYPGATANVAVNCGAPGGVLAAKTMGLHKARWLMLAPNSDKIPARIRAELLGFITGLLTPSAWGKDVLDAIFEGVLPVRVCQHGVMPEYRWQPRAHEVLERAYGEGHFVVGHFTSTNSQRKGTRELLKGWALCMERRELPENARLLVYCQHRGVPEATDWIEELGLTNVEVHGSIARPAEEQSALYQRHHAIVQPSRAEGFGLVPLEARACGIPVGATAITGHADHVGAEVEVGPVWMAPSPAGVVVIRSGEDGPMDDMPGATAPTLDPQHVSEAIYWLAHDWSDLHAGAVEEAGQLRTEWSWEARTAPVLRELVEECA